MFNLGNESAPNWSGDTFREIFHNGRVIGVVEYTREGSALVEVEVRFLLDAPEPLDDRRFKRAVLQDAQEVRAAAEAYAANP